MYIKKKEEDLLISKDSFYEVLKYLVKLFLCIVPMSFRN